MVRDPAAAIRDLLVFGVAGARINFAAVQGLKQAEHANNWIFPVLDAVSGESPGVQIQSHRECGHIEPSLGPGVPLGPGILAVWGPRATSSGGSGLGTEGSKKRGGKTYFKRFVLVPTMPIIFQNEAIFSHSRVLVPPTGGVRTEKSSPFSGRPRSGLGSRPETQKFGFSRS